MSSLFVQVTVVPTGTVIVCGPKRSLAATLGDPANRSSKAIITVAAAAPATRTFVLFVLFPFSSLISLLDLDPVKQYPGRSLTAPSPRVANRRLPDCGRSPHTSH